MAAAEEHRSGAERRAREQAAALERELKQERSATQTLGRQQQQRIRHLEDQLRSLKARSAPPPSVCARGRLPVGVRVASRSCCLPSSGL